jgi:hypothetical protein
MKNRILSFVVLFTSLSGMAQEEKIIVIDRGVRGRTKPQKEQKLVDNDHVLKFSPLQMVMGEINLGFEKKMNEMSSLEFELGPTLSEVGFTVNEYHYYDPWGYPSQSRNTGVGFFGSVGYRFYPMDNTMVLNRFYVSPVFKYRLYNFQLRDFSGILDDQKGSENQAMFTFNFGYQKWLSDHFSLDMFAGFGLAFEGHDTYYLNSVYDGNTGTYIYNWEENNFNGVRFAFTMGVKVGIGN